MAEYKYSPPVPDETDVREEASSFYNDWANL